MKQFTEEALTLIISEITGSITPEEQQQLDDLMRRYPQIRELSRFLYENPEVEEASITTPTDAEAYEFVAQLRARKSKTRAINTRKVLGWAACTLLVVAGICGLWFSSTRNPLLTSATEADTSKITLRIGNKQYDLTGSKSLSIDSNRKLHLDNKKSLIIPEEAWQDTVCKIMVPPRKKYLVKLVDGSLIALKSATHFTFPLLFQNTARSIDITGDADVTVSASRTRKFIVNLSTSRVEAYGTKFKVSSYQKSEDKVTLVSGRVDVTDGFQTKNLLPGYEAIISDSAIAIDKYDSDDLDDWEMGIIQLSSASDWDIINAAERYYHQKIIFQRPSSGNRLMLSFDRNQPIDSFLSQVADPKNISKKAGVIYIK